MQFLDEAKIFLSSGHGGRGASSFMRAKFIPLGGPDGGNGGRGGDVIFVAMPGLNTLIDFRYRQHFKASPGTAGRGRNQHGAASESLVIHVPAGTQIYSEDHETLLADLVNVGDEIVLLKGGDGGFGNAHYKTSTNQAPERAMPGFPGEERWVWLKLKLISDVGLVGMPNAGKSTLLSRVSAARPKIADYPFTTLKPQLGVVQHHLQTLVMADIPGLIEGAHEGVGLGVRFLKHIERCRVLLHLLDGTHDDPVQSYLTIRHELESYSPVLAKKPELIVLNKNDALDAEDEAHWIKALAEIKHMDDGLPVLSISAVSGAGLLELHNVLFAMLYPS